VVSVDAGLVVVIGTVVVEAVALVVVSVVVGAIGVSAASSPESLQAVNSSTARLKGISQRKERDRIIKTPHGRLGPSLKPYSSLTRRVGRHHATTPRRYPAGCVALAMIRAGLHAPVGR
jgi:hypothetical protein